MTGLDIFYICVVKLISPDPCLLLSPAQSTSVAESWSRDPNADAMWDLMRNHFPHSWYDYWLQSTRLVWLTFRIIIDIGRFDKITIRFGHIIILITFFPVASYWRRNGTKMEIKSISCPRSFLILKKTHVSSFKRNAVLANAINLASVSVHQPPNSIFGYDRFVTFLIAQTFHFHPIKIFDV